MQPARILPDLQCSLVCDEVRQEANGNFILLGIISVIQVPQLPVTALKLYVFNRWTAGIGTFQQDVRLIGPDQTTLLRNSQLKFTLHDASHNVTNVTLFGQVKFETAGVYQVEVLVDEVMKLRYPLPLAIIKQQPPQKPAPSGD